MIQNNNNLSVLPFYNSLDEQNHRKSYAYGAIYPLYTPIGKVPPFQVLLSSAASPSSITLYKADGTSVDSVTMSVTVKSFTGYAVMLWDGTGTVSAVSAEGQYYLAMSVGNTTIYSDIFTVVSNISAYTKVEWYDLEDLVMEGCRIVYDLGNSQYFKNFVYLNTELGKPEYEFEEEGETRDGLFFPEKMISEKTYKMTFLASEYMCDVMRFVRMSDKVKVTDKYGRNYQCDTFLITPKWETQGDLASVEVEFQTNVVAKRIGRAFT